MKNKRPFIYIAIAGVVLVFIYSFLQEDHTEYIRKVNKERSDKNRMFKFTPDSPLSEEQKKEFEGLNYFEVNPEFKIKAKLRLIHEPESIYMPTSDGQEKRYRKFAYAEFELGDKEHKLLLYKAEDSGANELFLPFYDQTSAEETYGGGRYLDLNKEGDRTIVIDFNKAYNPYCVYNAQFSCPIPPKENEVSIPVYVGEKNFEKMP